ncbi:cell division protein SepF [Archaeoglobus sp.]
MIFKLFKKDKVEVEDYEELDLSEYEAEIADEGVTYIKVAEVTGMNEISEVKRQVYNGNIVIAEIAYIKHDKWIYDKVIKELKQLAQDVKGDIVGLGEDYIIVTPTGIKVDRVKIRGSRNFERRR